MVKAQAEIARLQAEVERLRKDNDILYDTIEKVFAAGAAQWNDAIEAASDIDMILAAIESVHDMDVTHEDYARAISEEIRALISTPDQPAAPVPREM